MQLTATMSLCVVALASTALTPPAAQCNDPPLPQGGFVVRQDLDRPLTYRDSTQSRVDVRYPSTTPGTCGWPVVLFVHEFSFTRRDFAADLIGLAQEGYLVATWEVRGQGEWNTLNPTAGSQLMGRDERLDIVEVTDWLRTTYGAGPLPRADVNRLAFASRGPSGASLQGSFHAWAAAAWSGKSLPSNPRGLTRFPVFRAVTAALFPPLTAGVLVPQGKGLHPLALAQTFLVPSLRLDPLLQAALQPRMLGEDFAGVAALFDSDPFRQDLTELRTSSVPVLAGVGWNDNWAPAARTLEALAALPTTTPRHCTFGVFAFDAPYNDREAELFLGQQRRWLARFLKQQMNGIDVEARFDAGAAPADAAAYIDPTTLLWTRQHDAWPPPATTAQRWFARQNGVLATAAPTGNEPADRVQHQVRNGFDMTAYVTQAFIDVAATLQAIPLSSVIYESPPLVTSTEIAGAARVRVEVTPTTRNYQVHCALTRVDVHNQERFLASGVALVRGNSVAPASLDVTLHDLDTVLSPGDRVRVRIENVAYRRPPMQDSLGVAPYFESTAFDVQHTAARPTYLDLPVRDVVQPSLSTRTHDFAVSMPTNIRYELAAPQALGGEGYVTVFGFTGTSMQTALPASDPLRLNFDAMTSLMLGVGPPTLFRNPGTLDPLGRQYPSLELRGVPVLAQLRGLRLSAAAVVLTSSLGPLATNTVDVFFR